MKITDLYPTNWSGKKIAEQRELFDQILTYFTQYELHNTYTRKISQEEWIKKRPTSNTKFCTLLGIFEDILNFYQLTELECGVKDTTYINNENILHRTYSGRLMLGSCFALPTLDLTCPREFRAIKHI